MSIKQSGISRRNLLLGSTAMTVWTAILLPLTSHTTERVDKTLCHDTDVANLKKRKIGMVILHFEVGCHPKLDVSKIQTNFQQVIQKESLKTIDLYLFSGSILRNEKWDHVWVVIKADKHANKPGLPVSESIYYLFNYDTGSITLLPSMYQEEAIQIWQNLILWKNDTKKSPQ